MGYVDPRLSFEGDGGSSLGKTAAKAYAAWCLSGLLGGHRFYLGRPYSATLLGGLTIVALPLMPAPLGALLLLAAMTWALVDACLIPRLVREANARQQPNSLPAAGITPLETAPTIADGRGRWVATASETEIVPDRRRGLNFDHSGSPAGAAASANRYVIDYADTDGVVTTREINVVEVTGSPYAIYIRALCRMRNAERTFRADRILSARRPGGPPISEIEQHFHELIPEEDRPDPDHETVMARVSASLGVLTWIAQADREISSDEREILLEFIDERNGLAGKRFAETPWNRARASAWIDAARPTFATSTGALAKMSRTGREYSLVQRYALRMAEVGGAASDHRHKQLFR